MSRLKCSEHHEAHKYYYWQIVSQWLARPGREVLDERLKNLNRQMAMKMLEKIVQHTDVDKVSTIEYISLTLFPEPQFYRTRMQMHR